MTSVLPLKPRELQSVSHLTARADSPSVKSSLFKVTLLILAALKPLKFHQSFITMYRNPSLNSWTDSDVFYVEESTPERSSITNNTPAIINSTQLSGAMEPESITISSVASPEPKIVTIDSDSNEPTFPYAFGSQHPKVPLSLKTSTCRRTPSMCWQRWPSFNRIKKTAPNHRSRLIHLPLQRPQWTWAQ